jgi:two-component system, chemotaxis family, chemotaxis protein CheY
LELRTWLPQRISSDGFLCASVVWRICNSTFRLTPKEDAGISLGVKDLLVVDDSKVMRDMIVACLRPDPDLAFTHAGSGLEALEKLSLQAYQLVVLDLNMPDIGGLEVVEFVRSQDALRDLPIIVVTTRGDEASRSQALSAGASRFITKPFSPEALLAEVRTLLQSRRAAE